jgi:hypothetical protein
MIAIESLLKGRRRLLRNSNSSGFTVKPLQGQMLSLAKAIGVLAPATTQSMRGTQAETPLRAPSPLPLAALTASHLMGSETGTTSLFLLLGASFISRNVDQKILRLRSWI